MAVEQVVQGGESPEEHAGVPEVAPGAKVAGSGARGGLFGKAADGEDELPGDAVGPPAALDVTVAGLGMRGRDAKDHHGVFCCGGGQRCAHDAPEAGFLPDGVVGGEDGQHSVGLPGGKRSADVLGGQGDGGSGVASEGFQQQLRRRHARQLAAEQRAVVSVADHVDAPAGKEAREAPVGVLEQRLFPCLSRSWRGQWQELLGPVAAAQGPEAGAVAPGDDDGIGR